MLTCITELPHGLVEWLEMGTGSYLLGSLFIFDALKFQNESHTQ